MRSRTLAVGLCVLALAQHTAAQDFEVAYPRDSWLSIGPPINSPDPESLTVHPITGNLVMTNGNDTSDGDGESIIEFTLSTPRTFVKAYARGDDMEAAIAAYTGADVTNFTNVDLIGLVVNTQGDVILPLDDGDDSASAAWLLRVNAESVWTETADNTSIDILAGSTTGNGPVDGTIHLAIDGDKVYLLQRQIGGAPETRVVSFDSLGSDQQEPTVVLSQSDLLAAMGQADLDALNSIAVRGTSIVLVAGEPNLDTETPGSANVYSAPVAGGPVTLLKSGTEIAAEAVVSRPGYGGFFGIDYGAIAINPSSGDIYLGTWDTEVFAFLDNYDILRIDGDTLVAEVFKTEDDMEANPLFIAEGDPTNVEAQSYGLAVSADHLYMTLETEASNTDMFARLTIPNDPVIIADGDLNGDGVVNVVDVTLLGNAVSGQAALPPESNGDLNEDGMIDTADVEFLVDQILNP